MKPAGATPARFRFRGSRGSSRDGRFAGSLCALVGGGNAGRIVLRSSWETSQVAVTIIYKIQLVRASGNS